MKNFNALNAFVYTTRTWALIICVVAIIGMISNQFGMSDGVESFTEIISFFFFPLATCTGLMIGYKNELWGGVISLLSLVVFFAISPELLEAYDIVIYLSTPSILYLVIHFIKKRKANLT